MAGKRQHYLPQFLQSGFAHERRNGLFTWVYRGSDASFETNIKNNGVESRFYDKGEDNSVDAMITEAEAKFSALVENARALPFGDVPRSLWPEFVAHLEVRGRHLRRVLLDTSGYLVRFLVDKMANTVEFGEYVERQIRAKPELVDEAVLEKARELKVTRQRFPGLIREARANVPAVITRIKTQVLPLMAEHVAATFPEKILKQVRDGHVDALKSSDGAPKVRVERYAEFSYSLIKVEAADLILGDCAVLFQTEGAREWKPLTDNTDRLKAVLLPLSKERLLVGRMDAETVEVPDVNMLMARASMEFFISNDASPRCAKLASLIGSDALPLSPDELRQIVESVVAGS